MTPVLDETDPLPLARDGPNAAPTLPASIRMMPVRSAVVPAIRTAAEWAAP